CGAAAAESAEPCAPATRAVARRRSARPTAMRSLWPRGSLRVAAFGLACMVIDPSGQRAGDTRPLGAMALARCAGAIGSPRGAHDYRQNPRCARPQEIAPQQVAGRALPDNSRTTNAGFAPRLPGRLVAAGRLRLECLSLPPRFGARPSV